MPVGFKTRRQHGDGEQGDKCDRCRRIRLPGKWAEGTAQKRQAEEQKWRGCPFGKFSSASGVKISFIHISFPASF
jgi:hypothetical protein